MYPETTQGAYFAIDGKKMFIDKTCFMLIAPTSEVLSYLQTILSSKLFEFAYKKIFSSVEIGEKGYQYNKHALIKLPVIPLSKIINNLSLDKDSISIFNNNVLHIPQKKIDETICFLYGLTKEEQEYIMTM